VSNPNGIRRLGYCGDRNYGEIGKEFHALYDNQHPDLTPYTVEQIHQRWTILGKLAKAGRL
jgi:hypothetical protein